MVSVLKQLGLNLKLSNSERLCFPGVNRVMVIVVSYTHLLAIHCFSISA